MGTLSRIGLDCLVQRNNLDALVETGTGHGHNLITALQWPELRDIRSIELDYQTYHRAVVTFSNEPRVKVYHGDSAEILGKLAGVMHPDRRVLWFLDAHFVGSGRIEPIPFETTVGISKRDDLVPLEREVLDLLAVRNVTRDVIVVDDLCLFEPGDYEHDAYMLREQLALAPLKWLDDRLAKTHEVRRLMHDGGYWIAEPR